MGLSQAQKAMIERARSSGTGDQAVPLTDEVCAYLVARIAQDLGLQGEFRELPQEVRPFFDHHELELLRVAGAEFLPLMERLVNLNSDADTFFVCLASLHKRRLKYDRILQTQPIPTIEQVGPRGLLQFGTISARALTALLFWGKWLYDIDNRDGQETGYLFEPIIASAIGGTPVNSRSSPVRRTSDKKKGRQVDCIRDRQAYEFKIRVTIASSGQGRWREELDFPVDCRHSGYKPILVVLDATPNPKLQQLESVFLEQGGEVYIGESAWRHLDAVAGSTMALFLDKYVREPIQSLLAEVPDQLPEFIATMDTKGITLSIGGEELVIRRAPEPGEDIRHEMSDDAAD